MKPPRVDRYAFWGKPPPQSSPRLAYWIARIEAGWRPNRRISRMGYDEAAAFYGVYLWEYFNVLWHKLHPSEPELTGRQGAIGKKV